MLTTVAHRLAQRFPQSRRVIGYNVGTVDQRRSLGLEDVLWVEHHRLPYVRGAFNTLARINARRAPITPDPERRDRVNDGARRRPFQLIMRGLRMLNMARAESTVLGSEVDVVLDLSGFAYGDPWGPLKVQTAARYYNQIHRRGGKIVLMPQQLGPFDRTSVRAAFHHLSEHCDLIYARDAVSHGMASEVVAEPAVLRQAPDFTILQPGTPPRDDRFAGRACIVPNAKMLDKTTAETKIAYPVFLRRCVDALAERGISSFVLIHEHAGGDHEIAQELSDAVEGIEVIDESRPLRIKGIIGASHITIGSRFHGLVSALSQAVPSLGTSWSHKYQMLFAEYGCPECLLDPTLSDEALSQALNNVLVDRKRSALMTTLRERNDQQQQRVNEMWEEVETLVAKGPDEVRR